MGFGLPPGWLFTTPNVGSDTSDSDADQTTGRTPVVTLPPGEVNPTVDAGLTVAVDYGDLPDTGGDRRRRLPDAAGERRPAASDRQQRAAGRDGGCGYERPAECGRDG